jgi:hypothetical protein
MGKTLEEQQVLKQKIRAAEKHISVGALYRHHKSPDKIYKVLGIGIQEADDVLHVIYQAQYDERLTFLRPVDVWLEQVEWEGQTVPRFSKVLA